MHNNGKGALVALTSFGLFSVHDLLVKLLGSTYSPVQILFFTVLFSFPFFSLTLIRHKRSGSLRPNRPLWTGIRTARPLSASARLIACRIHHEA